MVWVKLLIFVCTAYLANADKKIFECGNGYSNESIYVNISNALLTIQSPNYGRGNYGYNQFCVFEFITGSEPVVLTFTVINYNLEYGTTRCPYDYTCTGGDIYCGFLNPGTWKAYRVKENSTFTVIFRSDSSRSLSGFENIFSPNGPDRVGRYSLEWSCDTFVKVLVKKIRNGRVGNYTDKCKNFGYKQNNQRSDNGYATASSSGENVNPAQDVELVPRLV